MNKAEFEEKYAKSSGLTVDQLHEFGMYGVPCDCGEDGCRGWRMKSQPDPEERLSKESKMNEYEKFRQQTEEEHIDKLIAEIERLNRENIVRQADQKSQQEIIEYYKKQNQKRQRVCDCVEELDIPVLITAIEHAADNILLMGQISLLKELHQAIKDSN